MSFFSLQLHSTTQLTTSSVNGGHSQSQLHTPGTHYHLTLHLVTLYTPLKNTAKHTCSDSLNLKPPAPPYPLQDFKALYKCCIIIIIIIIIIIKELLQDFIDCNWCRRLTYKGSNACSIMSLAVDVKKRCGQATG